MFVVIATGLMLTVEGYKTLKKKRKDNKENKNKNVHDDEVSIGIGKRVQNLPIPPRIYLDKSGVMVSAIVPVLAGFLVGTMAGFFGVGGGIIMMPILVYVLGIPTVVAIGTDLFQMIFTASNATIAHAISGNIDYVLALLMIIGAVIGAQIGARSSKIIHGSQIRIVFGIIVLSVGVTLILKLLKMDELKLIVLGAVILVAIALFMYCLLALLGVIKTKKQKTGGDEK
jgi:hypothetical protein